MYLDESGIKKLRNLYVQLDSVSSNKSYTLAAAFAALIYLDMRMKVKVPYLEVIGFYNKMRYFNEETSEGGMHSKKTMWR